jgi:transcriptional regulator with XRE-family HTH domain
MFGEVLKSAREKAGMTQEKLAFEADIDRTYISRLENNKMSPTLDTLLLLGDALGVPASTLIARVERRRKR